MSVTVLQPDLLGLVETILFFLLKIKINIIIHISIAFLKLTNRLHGKALVRISNAFMKSFKKLNSTVNALEVL